MYRFILPAMGESVQLLLYENGFGIKLYTKVDKSLKERKK